jgi:hypothetical protein
MADGTVDIPGVGSTKLEPACSAGSAAALVGGGSGGHHLMVVIETFATARHPAVGGTPYD